MDDEGIGSEEALRAAFLAEYDDALAAGKSNSSLPHPDLPPEVQARLDQDFAGLQLLGRLRPRRPAVAESTLPASPCAAAQDARYQVLGLHAVGGIGRVWLVRDAALGRNIALKDLRPDRNRQATIHVRFLREAQITGQLQHPGIIPVYELVSRAASVPGEPPADFYTMRLIKGRTLTEAARDYHLRQDAGKAGPLERIALINAFVSACNTVAYAHDRGVIHRDLKGANIVLGDFGEVVVLDWGFAKVLDRWDGPALTCEAHEDPASPSGADGNGEGSVPGQVMGTPAYMAPEQATGRIDDIDERTDVFGLGAILYEVLTGRPPFLASDAANVLRETRTESPPRPTEVRTSVPRALEAICMRAMAYRRDDRYPNVAELAREIQHWLADEAVQAYPETRTARLGRWTRRHQPTVAAAAALIGTAVIAIAAIMVLVGEERARVAAVKLEAEHERAEADARSRSLLAANVYFERIALAEREIDVGNISRAIQYLSACPADRRGWEWHCLQRLCRTKRMVLTGHDAAVASVALSPD
jgi:serine/threonine protein kinase